MLRSMFNTIIIGGIIAVIGYMLTSRRRNGFMKAGRSLFRMRGTRNLGRSLFKALAR